MSKTEARIWLSAGDRATLEGWVSGRNTPQKLVWRVRIVLLSADRAGVMGVLYAHFRLGMSIRDAVQQLSFRYLHVRHGKTGVLDYVFERYLAEAEPKGISFLDWVESDAYDPKKIKEDFKAQWWGTLITERMLRRE